ncbi:MAG: hypothetical protein HQL69_20950 [Magnetococcales bacterium]|nr:hypothetical protein [Magnetococcales bacterium]
MFKITSIQNQIIFVVLLSLVLSGVIGGTSLFEMNKVRSDIQEISQTDLPLNEHLAKIENFQLKQGVLIERSYRYLESGQINLLGPIEKHLNKISVQIEANLKIGDKITIRAIHIASNPTAKSTFENIHRNFSELKEDLSLFTRLIHKIFLKIKDKKLSEARILFEEIEKLEVKLVQKQEHMLHAIEDLSEKTSRRAVVSEIQGINHLLFVLLASIAISLFLSLRLAKGVILPLAQASEIADRISKNKHDIKVPEANTLEIQNLFSALEHMVQAIQERKRLEHMLMISDKMSSIGRLAAGIAHEINNPLASATMGLQTLKMHQAGQSNKLISRKLLSIEKNLDRASTIARELLTFSREKKTNLLPVNLQDEVEGALTLIGHKLKHVSVHQEWNNVPDICGDYVKLEQVFMNILTNAADAMPDGGEIRILGFCKENDVFVKISDDGNGIDEEVLPNVFDPFFTTKEIGRGTGLGLSICYNTIVEHGGTIEISSTVGQGSTVTVRLSTIHNDC